MILPRCRPKRPDFNSHCPMIDKAIGLATDLWIPGVGSSDLEESSVIRQSPAVSRSLLFETDALRVSLAT